MLKILLVVFILLALAGGLIYFRFFVSNKASTVSPQASEESSEVSQEPIEVPKTLPDAPIEDKVKVLEETITTLVDQVNSLKAAPSSQNLDLRLKGVEAGVTELKVRISSLEQATPAPVQTTSTSNPPLYIPLGSSGSTMSQAFVNMDTYQITLNPADYSGYKNMQLEVSIRRNQPGNSVYARLYNSTDNTVTSSEISTTSTSFVWLSSSGFSLASGSKTYILQLKVPDGTEAFIQTARIKVNY